MWQVKTCALDRASCIAVLTKPMVQLQNRWRLRRELRNKFVNDAGICMIILLARITI